MANRDSEGSLQRRTNQDGTRVRVAHVSGAEFLDVAARLTHQIFPDLDDKTFHLGFSLSRAASMHVQASEARIHRPKGWSWSAFRVMYIIWVFRQVEARDLARLSGVSRQATSSVLATLEGNGLIVRERDSNADRRLVSVRLSSKGQAAITEAFAAQHRLEREWFGSLTTEEQATLLALLDRLGGRHGAGTRPSAGAASELDEG
ncbi:MAG TPA: MarR family transcriptional regulator [Dermatophilaceae bacterium]|nr:MarR family transcriptional regulator [Dermatophilaceae bacterium]